MGAPPMGNAIFLQTEGATGIGEAVVPRGVLFKALRSGCRGMSVCSPMVAP